MDKTLEQLTMRKVTLRIVPYIILLYIVAYLDRVNLAFASLTMNADLGLSASSFGFGAGLFFITYVAFEVPSNIALQSIGARRWIARIMLTWGLISAAMVFATGPKSFAALRALLGVAEAGFSPGVLFFLAIWFPRAYRGRVVAYFMAAIPLASVVGAPLSSLILEMDGLFGLAGWKWLFLAEALPALILAVVVFRWLPDAPREATWLSPAERSWLTERLEAERTEDRTAATTQSDGKTGLRVFALGLVYFGTTATNYALGFWLPQIVKAFGLSNLETGFVSMIPFAIGVLGMIAFGLVADRTARPKYCLVAALAIAAAGLAAAGAADAPLPKMIALSFASFGIYGALPVFWAVPLRTGSSRGLAAGIAVIGSIGSLSGFVVPWMIGLIKDATGSFNYGLFLVAVLAIVALVILLALRERGRESNLSVHRAVVRGQA